MIGVVDEEASRPRPLSGGIWTLFSWLRRSERFSSSESLSSVGSDRTAASFDFLAPINYKFENRLIVTKPLDPPTDSYKRRVHDRNIRWQRERNLTLHRKYGLFRSEGSGYDAFSLPPARRAVDNISNRQERDRRATSECLQRRAAHVPGKRRAPLPPTISTSTTLPRSNKRKRPAPKPPVKRQTKEISQQSNTSILVQMNCNATQMNYNVDKCSKHEVQTKDTKSRTDKSFFKKILENKKRNSVIETTTIKLLPNISELDKQAAEIIEMNKKKRINQNSLESHITEGIPFNLNMPSGPSGDTWICTKCLRKYDGSKINCTYCVFKKNAANVKPSTKNSNTTLIVSSDDNNGASSSRRNDVDEKRKLKEMLKEMKDSLPKNPKHKNQASENIKQMVTESPTLRIGSKVPEEQKYEEPSTSKNIYSILQCNDSKLENKDNLKLNLHHASTSDQSSAVPQNNRNSKTVLSPLISALESPPSWMDKKYRDNFDTDDSDTKDLCIENTPKISEIRTEIIRPKVNVQNITSSASGARRTNLHNENTQSTKILLNTEKNPSFESKQIKGASKESNSRSLLNKLSMIAELPTSNHSFGRGTNNLSTSNSERETLHKAVISQVQVFTPVQIKSNDIHKNVMNSVQSGKLNDESQPNCSKTSKNFAVTKIDTQDDKLKMKESSVNKPYIPLSVSNNGKIDIQTPLRISSLLNPIYIPKTEPNVENKNNCEDFHNYKLVQSTEAPKSPKLNNTAKLTENKTNLVSSGSQTDKKIPMKDIKSEKKNTDIIKVAAAPVKSLVLSPNCSAAASSSSKNISEPNEHVQRRDLINQLEQSIAKGDERAAAEAAIKLAKLRLSCSVLSFSSQIVGETPKVVIDNKITDTANTVTQQLSKNESQIVQSNPKKMSAKIETAVDTNGTQLESLTHVSAFTHLNKGDINSVHKVEENEGTEHKKNDNCSKEIKPQAPQPPSCQSSTSKENTIVSIEVWVEDKEAARGPVRLRIQRQAMLRDLRQQAELSLGLATRLQRWIVGRTLCTDDNTPLESLAGPDLKAPFYLCLVESESIKENEDGNKSKTENKNAAISDVYTELVKLEQQALVPNTEPFECEVCMENCVNGAGVVLRECIHAFCRECLSDMIRHCEEPVVACPATACPGNLQEREIRGILTSEQYEKWLARGLAAAESGTRNTFHCRTRDCTGWAFCEPGVRRFPCPVCKHTNCVQCQAIHEGETCEQYQTKLRETVTAAETNQTDEGTQTLLNSLIARGEALECPECKAIITKKWGCDWVKCSACKTEICWVTKGRRWGPGGRGDTSAGCRCGVDGKRCHPSCGYCH